jgi:hypothetical protein
MRVAGQVSWMLAAAGVMLVSCSDDAEHNAPRASGGDSGRDASAGTGGTAGAAGTAGTGGTAGTAGSGGGAGADDGAAPEFVNPVALSESDATVLGTDGDGNGVRDDLAAYLTTLAPMTDVRTLLVSYARMETQMLVLGADPNSTVSAVREQAHQAMAVHRCLLAALGPAETRRMVVELQSALLNNEMRWNAWLSADRKLAGGFLENKACDMSLVHP